ncbi:MAG: response regulator [Gammaproteobacteria bacterium]
MQYKRILVVDDSPTAGALIKLHLDKLGYEVAGVVCSADEALQQIRQSCPDLVLMDINLGEGMTGIEAADIIMHRFHVPVIYVTSYSDDQTLESAKQTMPYGFINKPFRDNDLRVNIELALERVANEQKTDHVPSQKNGVNDTVEPDLELSPLSEALNHLASGVIMVNEQLEIHYTNKSAIRILDGNASVKIKDKQLSCANSRIKKDLQKHVNANTSAVFTVNRQDKPLHFLIFPLNSQFPDKVYEIQGSVLFIFDTARNTERIEDVIRTMYKLSPTEARIAARLVYNPYLTEISATMGITYNTARTHLKRIYQKTDTKKLPALIQKIVTGPAGLLIHSTE